MSFNCGNKATLGVHSHETLDEVKTCQGISTETITPRRERQPLDLSNRAGRTIEVPAVRAQSSFTPARYNATITEVTPFESSTGSIWVTFKLETGDFKRPVFSDVTVAGRGATIVDILHFRLTGVKYTDAFEMVEDTGMALWLTTLVGTTVDCWIREDDNAGQSILRTSVSGWKKAQLS